MKERTRSIIEQTMQRLPGLESCRSELEAAFSILKRCYSQGSKVLVCGNGGSAADCEHIVGELMKGFRLRRGIPAEDIEKIKAAFPENWESLADNLQGALPAISLAGQTSLCSAVINDVGAGMMFAQQVYGYGKKGDVLIGISTSGNAENVVMAIKTAKAFGLETIGLTGKEGGLLKDLSNLTIRVAESSTERVQENHLPVYHLLCAMLESEFFEE